MGSRSKSAVVAPPLPEKSLRQINKEIAILHKQRTDLKEDPSDQAVAAMMAISNQILALDNQANQHYRSIKQLAKVIERAKAAV